MDLEEQKISFDLIKKPLNRKEYRDTLLTAFSDLFHGICSSQVGLLFEIARYMEPADCVTVSYKELHKMLKQSEGSKLHIEASIEKAILKNQLIHSRGLQDCFEAYRTGSLDSRKLSEALTNYKATLSTQQETGPIFWLFALIIKYRFYEIEEELFALFLKFKHDIKYLSALCFAGLYQRYLT